MADKRKLKRRHLIFYLRVLERPSGKVIGFLVDITTEGFMMMSESPVEPGKKHKLKLMVEDHPDGDRYIEFTAMSRWCHRSINSDFYDVGFELEDVSIREFKGIRKIIQEFGFND